MAPLLSAWPLLLALLMENNGSRPVGAVRGRISHLAGSMSNRVLEELDVDLVMEHLDVNAVVSRIDVDALFARADLDAVLDRVDFDAMLARIDLNALFARVDLDPVLARVDVAALFDRVDIDRVLARVDLAALVQRAGIPEIITDSTGQLAGSALDLARRQLVGIDIGLMRIVQRLLRRDPDAMPAGPPALVGQEQHFVAAPDPETPRVKARAGVSGFYAGPVSRLLAFAGDLFLATTLFAAGVSGLSWLLGTLFGLVVPTSGSGWPWALAIGTWLFVYWWLPTLVAGRTPAMLLAGLRVVDQDGTPLRPLGALLRTVTLPFSLLAFGLPAAWMVVDRQRRAAHDLLARSTVVYDWGGRTASMPTPLARWIEDHDGR